MNDKVVEYLETLVWPNINVRVLTYPDDHKKLITGFRNLLCDGHHYNIDIISNWLYFHQPENRLNEWVIEDIVRLSEYVNIDFSIIKNK